MFFIVSPVLDCGHTLVGGKKVVQMMCENRGGDGKFCVMRKSSWPSTTFQVSLNLFLNALHSLHALKR